VEIEQPVISFCTTCSNRVNQLKLVFEENIAKIAAHSRVEWILVNFNSKDDLDNFIFSKIEKLPRSFIYIRELSGRPWHLSVAKNVAHRLAHGTILMNLDCDNRILDAIATIRRYFSQGCKCLHNSSGVFSDGTAGRIAINSELFFMLGGYDEALYPMGYQDRDLIERASAAEIPIVRKACPPHAAIKNSKKESVCYCRYGQMTWEDYNSSNRMISFRNIAAGRLVANCSGGWGTAHVEEYYGGNTIDRDKLFSNITVLPPIISSEFPRS